MKKEKINYFYVTLEDKDKEKLRTKASQMHDKMVQNQDLVVDEFDCDQYINYIDMIKESNTEFNEKYIALIKYHLV